MTAVLKKKNTKRYSVSDWFLLILACFFGLCSIVPIVYIISASLSDPYEVFNNPVFLFPKGISLVNYEMLLKLPQIWQGYYNTLIYTVFGTLMNVSVTILAAYALSRKELYLRRFWSLVFTLTMFFSGGMIPTYLIVKDVGILNSRWAIWLVSLVSTYNLMIARTYFINSIPEEIREAAVIDGASEVKYFFKVALPLAAPIIAVLTMFYASSHWNNYFNAMIYLPTNKALRPLQLYLREILILESSDLSASTGAYTDAGGIAIYAMTLKYAIIVVAILPILIAFPWIQKYFTKGLMVGSLKG